MVCVDELGLMRVRAERQAQLARAPGKPTLMDEKPLVKVRTVYGRAIAYTPTHVLHEWVKYGEYHCRWDYAWQILRVTPDQWFGEALPD